MNSTETTNQKNLKESDSNVTCVWKNCLLKFTSSNNPFSNIPLAQPAKEKLYCTNQNNSHSQNYKSTPCTKISAAKIIEAKYIQTEKKYSDPSVTSTLTHTKSEIYVQTNPFVIKEPTIGLSANDFCTPEDRNEIRLSKYFANTDYRVTPAGKILRSFSAGSLDDFIENRSSDERHTQKSSIDVILAVAQNDSQKCLCVMKKELPSNIVYETSTVTTFEERFKTDDITKYKSISEHEMKKLSQLSENNLKHSGVRKSKIDSDMSRSTLPLTISTEKKKIGAVYKVNNTSKKINKFNKIKVDDENKKCYIKNQFVFHYDSTKGLPELINTMKKTCDKMTQIRKLILPTTKKKAKSFPPRVNKIREGIKKTTRTNKPTKNVRTVTKPMKKLILTKKRDSIDSKELYPPSYSNILVVHMPNCSTEAKVASESINSSSSSPTNRLSTSPFDQLIQTRNKHRNLGQDFLHMMDKRIQDSLKIAVMDRRIAHRIISSPCMLQRLINYVDEIDLNDLDVNVQRFLHSMCTPAIRKLVAESPKISNIEYMERYWKLQQELFTECNNVLSETTKPQ